MKAGGFTFIEVLFALFIAGLVALTVGYTIIISLRAEARGQGMQEAALLLSSQLAAVRLELDEDESAAATYSGWHLTEEETITGSEPEPIVWRLNRLSHNRAGFQTRMAFQ